MKPPTDFPKELCADEAVCFIADRHHVTPQQLLHYFLIQKSFSISETPTNALIPLEPNEIEILKGLSDTIKD